MCRKLQRWYAKVWYKIIGFPWWAQYVLQRCEWDHGFSWRTFFCRMRNHRGGGYSINYDGTGHCGRCGDEC